jgi:putative phosphoribosyl transferase
MPEPFNAVGLWYEEFSQTSDEEVRRLLETAAAPATSTAKAGEVAEAFPSGQ